MTAVSISGDERFYRQNGPHSLGDIAAAVGAEIDAAQAPMMLTGVAPLQTAEPGQLSFLDNRKYAPLLAQTRASAVILQPEMADRVPQGCVALATKEPYLGWARSAAMFHPPATFTPGRHPTALIDPTASIDPSSEIGAYAVIGARVSIGARCRIGIGTVISDGVVLGDDARVASQCTISHAVIGARVAMAPGVRIGQEGFGFATIMEPTGPKYLTIPQLGRVIIEDDVEIGANTTIDRGSAQDTVISAGTRLDNLVQVGHNVRLGRACVIVAQVGISGSTVLEDFVVVAGQVGFAGHVHVGRGVRIGGQAGVMGDIPAGAEYVGSPAQPARQFFREHATLRKMANERIALRSGGAKTAEKESGSD